jgi:START domain
MIEYLNPSKSSLWPLWSFVALALQEKSASKSVSCLRQAGLHRVKSFSIIFLLLLFLKLHGQEEWKLSRNENGIKVYTAKGENSKFKRIKVEAIIPGSIEKLRGVLLDVSNNKRWVYHTRQSHLVEQINANEILYYAETSLPWPISNRDMVIRMNFNMDSVNNYLVVTAVGEPEAVPVKEGIVRIRQFNGRWEVKSQPSNQIAITYYLTVNPAGSVSPGITNMFVAKGPFETFNNLAGLLRE